MSRIQGQIMHDGRPPITADFYKLGSGIAVLVRWNDRVSLLHHVSNAELANLDIDVWGDMKAVYTPELMRHITRYYGQTLWWS